MTQEKTTTTSESQKDENNSTERSSGSSGDLTTTGGGGKGSAEIDLADRLINGDYDVKIVAENTTPTEEQKNKADHKRFLQKLVAVVSVGLISLLVISSLGMIIFSSSLISTGTDLLRVTGTHVITLLAGASLKDFWEY